MWILGDTVQSLMASDSWHRWDVAKDTTRLPEAPVILRGEVLGGALTGELSSYPLSGLWHLSPSSPPRPRAWRWRWLGLCAASGRRSVPAQSSEPQLVLHADSSEMSTRIAAGFAKGFPNLQGPVRAGAQLPRAGASWPNEWLSGALQVGL